MWDNMSSTSETNDDRDEDNNISLENNQEDVDKRIVTESVTDKEVEVEKYVKADVKLSKGRRVYKVKGQDPEYCLWPVAHGDIGELRKNGTYRSLPLGILLPQPLHPGTRSGFRQQAGINSIITVRTLFQTV